MEISSKGENSLFIKENEVAISINPADFKKLEGANIVLCTHVLEEAPDLGEVKVFDWPGEYESKGAAVHGISVKYADDSVDADHNIFHIGIEDYNICYIGDLIGDISDSIIDDIGSCDILIISLASSTKLKMKDASNIIEKIEPRIVIPVFSPNDVQTMKKFTDEVGAKEPTTEEKYKVPAYSKLPVENTEYVFLKQS